MCRGKAEQQRYGPEVRIRGPRLLLRPLRPAEIDAEWQAMVTADPMAVAELPDEGPELPNVSPAPNWDDLQTGNPPIAWS
jgi:hypothetical protein